MQTRKPLRAKTPIKARTPLKQNKRPKKQAKPAISKLKKEADRVFSLYVRYRDGKLIDGEWYTECITSGEWIPLKKAQAGHFMSRRYNATRYEEENVNGQSYRDNVLFYGEQYKYSQAVDLKYGDGTAKKLAKMAKQSHPFTTDELQAIIDDANKAIAFYQEQAHTTT